MKLQMSLEFNTELYKLADKITHNSKLNIEINKDYKSLISCFQLNEHCTSLNFIFQSKCHNIVCFVKIAPCSSVLNASICPKIINMSCILQIDLNVGSMWKQLQKFELCNNHMIPRTNLSMFSFL